MPPRLPALLAPGASTLWLANARLIDGTGGGAREGASVLVRDGRIERVGAAGEAVPEGATEIDLGGRTLMPGLVDAHAHVYAKPPKLAEGAEPLLPGTEAHSSAPTCARRCGAASPRSATSAPGTTSWSRSARRCASAPSAARGC